MLKHSLVLVHFIHQLGILVAPDQSSQQEQSMHLIIKWLCSITPSALAVYAQLSWALGDVREIAA